MKMGQTTTSTTQVDWNSVLTNATNFATAYLGYRSQVKGGAGQPGQPAPTPAPAPTGMSSNTRNLLIGGAVIAAGLLIYSMTKNK